MARRTARSLHRQWLLVPFLAYNGLDDHEYTNGLYGELVRSVVIVCITAECESPRLLASFAPILMCRRSIRALYTVVIFCITTNLSIQATFSQTTVNKSLPNNTSHRWAIVVCFVCTPGLTNGQKVWLPLARVELGERQGRDRTG